MSVFARPILTLCLLALIALPAVADHHESGGEMAMPEMGAPKQMSAVAQMVGDWDVSLKYRMTPADAWTTSKGTSTMEMVLNGCALQEHMTLDMMGMTMNGLQHLTFNRETGQYQSTWIDDMSGKMSMTVGDFVDGKLVMMGDDMQGGMPFKMRNSSHIVSDDEIVFAMEMSVDGGASWFDSMGITYTRAK